MGRGRYALERGSGQTAYIIYLFFNFYLFMIVTEREAETQAEGEAGSLHREPDVGLDPGSPGSRPGPKAGAKPLRHPGIPDPRLLKRNRRHVLPRAKC